MHLFKQGYVSYINQIEGKESCFVDNEEQEHVFLYVYMTARLLASTAELNKRLDACFAHCFNW